MNKRRETDVNYPFLTDATKKVKAKNRQSAARAAEEKKPVSPFYYSKLPNHLVRGYDARKLKRES